MANIQVQENCNRRSNAPISNLAPTVSYEEQILRRTDKPSFYTTLQNHRHAVRDSAAITLEDASQSDEEGVLSGLTFASHVTPTRPELLNHPLLHKIIRQTAREEAKRLYAFEMGPSLFKATEDVLSWAFHIGYEEINERLKNPLSYLVETVLTEMVQRVSLDDLDDRYLEKLTKSLTFQNTLTTHALTSTCSVRLVGKCIHIKTEKETHLDDNNRKKHE